MTAKIHLAALALALAPALAAALAGPEGRGGVRVEARGVSGAGFHRELRSVVSVALREGERAQDCALALVEHVQHTGYVDLDQVRDMRRLGVDAVPRVEPVGFRGGMDVERPAEASESRELAMVATALEEVRGDDGMRARATLQLPVHLRYQRPGREPMAEARWVAPLRALVACRDASDTEAHGADTGLAERFGEWTSELGRGGWRWREVDMVSGEVADLVLHVPVGASEHAEAVTLVTGAVACVGAAALSAIAAIKSRKRD